MESQLYEGRLRHVRRTGPHSDFEYSLFMVYLDLDELEAVFADRLLWSTRGPNLAWFRRADHYGDPQIPLDVAIRDLCEARTGQRPRGPIRLLTHLRYLGHCFNPVSFYYCFAPDGRTLETIVAEVNNTPWHERHMYVLSEADNLGTPEHLRFAFPKAFHVSPFLGMDMDYVWRFAVPADRLVVHMENHQQGQCVFAATLSMARRPLDGRELARVLLLRPLMTVKVVAAIHLQALRLLARGARFFPHPRMATPRQHES